MLNYKTKLYKMKKIALICAAAAAVVLLSSAKKDDGIMTKENGAYVINTTELGKQVDGYVGPTPLKVYIRKNKIEAQSGNAQILECLQEAPAEQMGWHEDI